MIELTSEAPASEDTVDVFSLDGVTSVSYTHLTLPTKRIV